MNALKYIGNLAKSGKYIAIDIASDYAPGITSLANQAAELSTDLYQSIKDFKSNPTAKFDENGFVSDTKDILKEYRDNLLEDLKSGNWYNKQRIDKGEQEALEAEYGSFDMGDDDFGDFDFEFSDEDLEDATKAEMSVEQQTTATTIAAMDAVGTKTAGAISTAAVRSADYIVASQKTSAKALYSLTNRGFGNLSTGLAAINGNIANIIKLGEPLTAHMQNSATFYTRSSEFQDKTLDMLQKIVDNTTVKKYEGTGFGNKDKTIDDLMTDGVLNISESLNYLKEGFKSIVDEVKMFTGIDMVGGLKGMATSMGGLKSPLAFAVKNIFTTLIVPDIVKTTFESFNKSLEGFFAGGMDKLRNKKFGGGPVGMLLGYLRDKLAPSSGYNDEIDTSNYEKGKVDWDGKSRKALIEVIPTQLAKIINLLGGGTPEIYDYERGKWIQVASIAKSHQERRNSAARYAGMDVLDIYDSTVDSVAKHNTNITKEQSQTMKDDGKRILTKLFHANNGDYLELFNLNDSEIESQAKEMGVPVNTLKFFINSLKRMPNAAKMSMATGIAQGRSSYGRSTTRMEESGDIETFLYNNAFNRSKPAKTATAIDINHRPRNLFGVDEYNNDVFFYLQGIYVASKHLADNIEAIGGGGGRHRGRRKTVINPTSIKKSDNVTFYDKQVNEYEEESYYNADNPMPGREEGLSISNEDLDRAFNADDKSIDSIFKNYINAPDNVKALAIKQQDNPGYTAETKEEKEAQKWMDQNKGWKELQGKMDKVAKGNKFITRVGDFISNTFKIPTNAMTGMLDAAQSSMTKVIYGKGATDETSLMGFFANGFKDLFGKLGDMLGKLIPDEVKDVFRNAWHSAVGYRDDTGKFANGHFSGLANDTEGAFKSARNWLFGIGNKEDASTAANGRRVTKSGIVAVSEGEMIVPAELNPFYHKKINKRHQHNAEYNAIANFYGAFANGTTATGKRSATDRIKDAVGDTANATLDETENIVNSVKNSGIVNGAKGVLKTGSKELLNGFAILIQELTKDGDSKPGENPEDKHKELKKNVIDAVTGAFKDAGDNRGAVAAGAIIGGGTSLFTGSIIGPIVGASLGAATGLVIKSKTMQDALFGKEITDDQGNTSREGGVFSKKVSNFMTKNLPSMAKGAAGGGAAGIFLGSPIAGAIVGSTIGFVQSSEHAKEVLFGKDTIDPKTGKPVEGLRKEGIIPKKLQDAIKKRLPGIEAGALLGGIAGPFGGTYGLLANLMVGSVGGFIVKGEKFQNWLFGKEDKNGNREGGFIKDVKGKVVPFIKEKFFDPIIGIFSKLGEAFKAQFRNLRENIMKFLRNSILARAGKRIIDHAKNSRIGRGIGKAARFITTPVRALANIPGAIDKGLERQALRNGYNIKDIESGKYLTAAERISRRGEKALGLSGSSVQESMDELIAGAKSPEELEQLQNVFESALDPTKGYDNTLIGSRRKTQLMLQNYADSKRDVDPYNSTRTRIAKNFNSLLRRGDFDEARKVLKDLKLDKPTYNAMLAEIDTQEKALSGRKNAKYMSKQERMAVLGSTNYAGKPLSGRISVGALNDNRIRNTLDLIKNERNTRDFSGEAKKGSEANIENTITDTIPDLLKKIMNIMIDGNPNLRKKYQKSKNKELRDSANKSAREYGEKRTSKRGQRLSNKISEMTGEDAESYDENGDPIIEEKSVPKILSTFLSLAGKVSGTAKAVGTGAAAVATGRINARTIYKGVKDKLHHEDGDTRLSPLTGRKQIYTNGEWKDDNTDTETKESINTAKATSGAIGVIPLIDKGVSKLNNTMDALKDGIFGSKEKKKKGLLGHLFSFLTGKESPWAMFASWFTGTTFGQTVTSILSKITFGSVMANLVAPALLIGGFAGKFDNLAYKLGFGGNPNQNITTDKNGNTITKNANGQYVDSNGKPVSSSDIVVRAADKASLTKNLIRQTARTVVFGTNGVASKIVSKTVIGKGAASVAKSVATTGLAETIMEGLLSLAKGLKRIPLLKNIDTDSMILALSEKVEKATQSAAAEKLAKFAANAVVFAKIAFIAVDFTTGYEDAATTMKVKKPTTVERIISGILRAVKNFIPVIGQLIPDDVLVDVFANFVAPAFGMSLAEFKKQRTEASNELAQYNAENGTNLTWSEYNKQVRHDYTWTERVGNTAKTTWAQTKAKFGKAGMSLKKGGVKGLISDTASSMKSNFMPGYSEMGGGVGGIVNGIGSSLQTILPGIFGEIPKKNAEMIAYALRGKMKELWSVSFDEFTKKNDNEADVGGFSKAIGQAGLLPGKLALTSLAVIAKPINFLLDKVKDSKKAADSNITLLGNSLSTMYNSTKDGDPDKVSATKFSPNQSDPFSGFESMIFGGAKLIFNIAANIGKWISPIGTAISEFSNKVKKFFGIPDEKDANTDKGNDGSGSGISGGGSGFVSQTDSSLANTPFGGSTFGQLGCGPAAATMALNSASGKSSLSNAISTANRYQTGTGTDASYFSDIYKQNGYNANYYDNYTNSGRSSIINSIGAGSPTVLMGQDSYNTSKSRSPFGPNNHYVVANGFDRNGNVIINDPESKTAGKKYSSSILNSVKMGIGMSGGASDTSSTEQIIWAFFKSKGYSEAATAGIMGNLMVESGLNPSRHQIKGPAKGIAQWESGRFDNLVKFAKARGKSWTDLYTQLEFIDKETNGLGIYFSKQGTSLSGFKSMEDPAKAAEVFEKAFERASKSNMDARKKYAQLFYKKYTGKDYSTSLSLASLTSTGSDTTTDSSTTTTATSGATTDSSTTTTGTSGLGVLAAITSAFSKLGDIFNGSSDTTSTTTDTTSTNSTNTTTDTSTSTNNVKSAFGSTVTIPGGPTITTKKTPIDYMKSMIGKLAYSLTGPRNPDKGSADCSSTVNWAIKKAGGPDIGAYSGTQYTSANLTPIWSNKNGTDTLPTGLLPNDVLFFKRDNSSYTDKVGHVGLYMGNNQLIDHGGPGYGPEVKDMTKGRLHNLIRASRVTSLSAGASGLLDPYQNSNGSKLLLLNNSNSNPNPYTASNIRQAANLHYAAGASGIVSTGGLTSTVSMTKDTALLLKVIISLVQSIVTNTAKIGNIYDVLAAYCKNSGSANGEAAAKALESLKNNSSGSDDIEKSLSDIKATVDSIFSSAS